MPISAAILEILKEVYFAKRKAGGTGGKPVTGPALRNWLKLKNIVVIGKGETGGKPIIEMFKKMNIKPTIIDSKTKNPKALTKKADIIISAVGKPNVIDSQNIKRGVILIGIGLFRGADGKLHGDFNEEAVKNIVSFYTSTPGGVGPVNVAMLLKNLIDAIYSSITY
ncbi:MAG: hypothetical protein HY424_03505 [Candidatus Levybacteria bacterium]|nr:hypothetical protein [Candidatus Levybacteria bacterium]